MTSMPADTNSKMKRKYQEGTPRAVTLTLGEAYDGRIPLTILVVPTADLDVQGGIFVDLRLGSRDPANIPAVVDDSIGPVTSIEKGDAAVAQLAKKEVAADKAALALEAANTPPEAAEAAEVVIDGDVAEVIVVAEAAEMIVADEKKLVIVPDEKKLAGAAKRKSEGKHPILAHQVGQALKLTVGQSESFRAEVAQPSAAPDGERWYVRARFSASTGQDLRSAWQRI